MCMLEKIPPRVAGPAMSRHSRKRLGFWSTKHQKDSPLESSNWPVPHMMYLSIIINSIRRFPSGPTATLSRFVKLSARRKSKVQW